MGMDIPSRVVRNRLLSGQSGGAKVTTFHARVAKKAYKFFSLQVL